jgi:hypothetical protein
MKHTLLSVLFILTMAAVSFAQDSGSESQSSSSLLLKSSVQPEKKSVRLYPNPATIYFQIQGSDEVDDVIIYNIFGRKVKSFEVRKGQKYDIETIPTGMYLVQILDQ